MAQSGLSARFRPVGGAPATSQMLAITDSNAFVPAPNAGAPMPRAVGLDIYVFGPNTAAFTATMANLANLLAGLPAPYPAAFPNALHTAAPIPWAAIPLQVSVKFADCQLDAVKLGGIGLLGYRRGYPWVWSSPGVW